MVLRRARWWIRQRSPLLMPLLACLGIQGVLSVLLLALAMLTDPSRSRPASAEAIVRLPGITVDQAYVVRRDRPQQHA